MTRMMITFILLVGALMIGVLCRVVTGLQASRLILCAAVTGDTAFSFMLVTELKQESPQNTGFR
jgi:hypothetical protein